MQVNEVNDFAEELLKKFNINSKDVISFNLHCAANKIPVITIRKYTDINLNDNIQTEKYKIVKVQSRNKNGI